ncbi:MAG: helix-turn-helix domain-containing protein, partial [Luteibacter sp.]
RAGRLSGAEIRFLRFHMELSQASLADLIGITAQTLALWEKGKGTITGPSDKLIRLIVKGHASGQTTIRRAIDGLNRLDAKRHSSRLVLRESGNKWTAVA